MVYHQWIVENMGVGQAEMRVLEDYDPSRSPVSYDVMYLSFLYIWCRCLAGMFR